MIWIAAAKCPLSVCQGQHRLLWDDIDPPRAGRVYAYSCPFKYRMTLINVEGLTWHRQGTREAFALQGLATGLMEWERPAMFVENDDGTPY